MNHLMSVVEPDKMKELVVAVDGGNGMAGVVVESVFDRIPPSIIGLYLEPDGTFPNHPADPLQPENLVDVIALVRDRSADLGVGFDGDADRAAFIDDQGNPLSGSTTTALIARWFLARKPGATIVHNLITSRAVPETVRKPRRYPGSNQGRSFLHQAGNGGDRSGVRRRTLRSLLLRRQLPGRFGNAGDAGDPASDLGGRPSDSPRSGRTLSRISLQARSICTWRIKRRSMERVAPRIRRRRYRPPGRIDSVLAGPLVQPATLQHRAFAAPQRRRARTPTQSTKSWTTVKEAIEG